MKIKTLIQSILVALLLLLSPIYTPVMGLSNNDHKFDSENFAKQNSLSDIDIIQQNKFITIQGVKNYLTPEFENPNNALVDLASKIKIYLGIIQQKYSLEEFSKDTVDIYYNSMMNSEDIGIQSNHDYIVFRNFYDIYENTDENRKIDEYVSTKTASELTNNDEKLYYLLPNTTPLVKSVIAKKQSLVLISPMATLNVTNAINYAIQYAISANLAYRIYSSDCTNFASQILDAGGKPQVYTGNETTGWWHTLTKDSIRWIRADAFVKYFQPTHVTYNSSASVFQTFTSYLYAGATIAADWTGDGIWDHVGFVVARDTYMGTYTDEDNVTRTYYDFRVAQHNYYYLAYTSFNNNDWEKEHPILTIVMTGF